MKVKKGDLVEVIAGKAVDIVFDIAADVAAANN